MSHQIFISYSTVDKLVADTLCHWLEENNMQCWIAPRDIPPDISALGELYNLSDLAVAGNNIDDFSSLAELNLTWLSFDDDEENDVEDLGNLN